MKKTKQSGELTQEAKAAEDAKKASQAEGKGSGKSKGWFSRRYETAERHDAARDRWAGTKSHESKAVDAVERASERAKRKPAEQLAVLDRRLGAGIGAVKERAKLNALIAKA